MITDNVELTPACFAAVSAAEIVPYLPKNCYSMQAEGQNIHSRVPLRNESSICLNISWQDLSNDGIIVDLNISSHTEGKLRCNDVVILTATLLGRSYKEVTRLSILHAPSF